jgi:hypothetical protein
MRTLQWSRRFAGIGLSVALVLVVAGCRVPEDSSPREIPTDQVPFDLLAPSSTVPAVTSPVPTTDGTIYLDSSDRLIAVKRSVPAPLSLGSLLAALVQGPTQDEATKGYTSSVGPQASVLSAMVTDGTAVIDISDAFSGIGVQEQITGLAQIVYTATELPGVQKVRIQLNSQPASVPRGDGSATTDPLSRADYAALAPK